MLLYLVPVIFDTCNYSEKNACEICVKFSLSKTVFCVNFYTNEMVICSVKPSIRCSAMLILQTSHGLCCLPTSVVKLNFNPSKGHNGESTILVEPKNVKGT